MHPNLTAPWNQKREKGRRVQKWKKEIKKERKENNNRETEARRSVHDPLLIFLSTYYPSKVISIFEHQKHEQIENPNSNRKIMHENKEIKKSIYLLINKLVYVLIHVEVPAWSQPAFAEAARAKKVSGFDEVGGRWVSWLVVSGWQHGQETVLFMVAKAVLVLNIITRPIRAHHRRWCMHIHHDRVLLRRFLALHVDCDPGHACRSPNRRPGTLP